MPAVILLFRPERGEEGRSARISAKVKGRLFFARSKRGSPMTLIGGGGTINNSYDAWRAAVGKDTRIPSFSRHFRRKKGCTPRPTEKEGGTSSSSKRTNGIRHKDIQERQEGKKGE